MSLEKLLDKLYQAKTPLEKYELNQELIRTLTSGLSHEEAKEFVYILGKLVHEHRYYRYLVNRVQEVFQEILLKEV